MPTFCAPGQLIGYKVSNAFNVVSGYYVDDSQLTLYYVDDSMLTYYQYSD